MPRRPRLAVPGIPWHIIERGNNRDTCFYDEMDYLYYLETLEEQADKYRCRIHAYVLMTNHVHLLLTPEKADSAGLLMKHLGQRYVQYIWELRARRYPVSGTDRAHYESKGYARQKWTTSQGEDNLTQ